MLRNDKKGFKFRENRKIDKAMLWVLDIRMPFKKRKDYSLLEMWLNRIFRQKLSLMWDK